MTGNSPDALSVRAAGPNDCAHLLILSDMATRRLVWWGFDGKTAPGQSALETGRSAILGDRSSLLHYSNWQVIEWHRTIIGGLNGYPMPGAGAWAHSQSDVLRPLNELKAQAAGSWYLSVAAVFPEHRNRGAGVQILNSAEAWPLQQGYRQLSLMVGSFNCGAKRLYQRHGFREQDRRPFQPFAGSDQSGEWILMMKDLD